MLLHIAFDATAIPANRAGAGIYIFNVVQALAQIDACNHYTVFAQPEFISEFCIDQPNFTFIPTVLASTRKRLIWEQVGLPQELRRRKVDILHSPHYTMPLRLPCRSIVTFHDMTFFMMPEVHDRFRRVFFRWMMRRSSRYADSLIAVSESTRADMARILSIPEGKIAAIPEAAGAAFRPLPCEETKSVCTRYDLAPDRYLLFVGVLEPRKNVPVLLNAYAQLADLTPDIPLVIAGKKGWMYEAIFQQVTALGLQERVRFLGYVPEPDLVALYNGARAFVYPSQYEGFGLPVLEAMQCGTPVITSNISSMPEVAGDAALLTAPGDSTALACQLRRLLAEDDLAKELSRRGLERARQFSWQRCARETLEVYHAVCAAAKSKK